MKKLVSIFLALTMLLTMAVGITSASAAEVTTFDFWTFNELHVEFYLVMAEMWNEANPDRPIAINPTSLGGCPKLRGN